MIDNDFDPDGDSFTVVRAHPRTRHRRQLAERRRLHTQRRASPASRPFTYTIRDSHGLTATGLATRVGRHRRHRTRDTGRRHRLLVRLSRIVGRVDHRRVACQRHRPARPSPDGRRRSPNPATTASSPATSPPGSPTPRATTPALINTDHSPQLPRHRHRRPRRPSRHRRSASSPPATPTNHPVARDDVARTDPATTVTVFVIDNDFDPDGDAYLRRQSSPPPTAPSVNARNVVDYTPNAGFSGVDTITYTHPRQPRPHRHRTRHACGSTPASPAQSTPVANTDYSYVYQGASVALTTAELLSNDTDPQGQALTVVVGVRTRQRRRPHRRPRHRVHLHPDQRPRPDQHRPRPQLPRHRHRRPRRPSRHRRSASSPPATPTSHPSRCPTRPPRRATAVTVSSSSTTTSIPTATAFSVVSVTTPPTAPSSDVGNVVHYTPNAGFSGIETITYTHPRHPRPDRQRTR